MSQILNNAGVPGEKRGIGGADAWPRHSPETSALDSACVPAS
jgi:hypothetical protein